VTTFAYATTPFNHQRDELRAAARQRVRFLAWEQGTGKTKLIIDNAAYCFLKGWIDGLVVVAPNGVHENWVADELPLHMSVPYTALLWQTGREEKRTEERFRVTMTERDRLMVLCINIDALITKKGQLMVKGMLVGRRCMMVVDESSDIATPSAKRTRAVIRLGRLAAMRRVLNGTPGDPLRIYSQYNFLDPKILGIYKYGAYKNWVAEWEERETHDGRKFSVQARDKDGKLIWKNIDELNRRKAPYTSRVLKKDVLDLPPKTYTKWYTYMSADQRRMYNELLNKFISEHPEGGFALADHVLKRYTRLQQVACGYVGIEGEEDEPVKLIPGPQPRVEAFLDVVDKYPGPTVVWCRFRMDFELLRPKLRELGFRVAEHHGGVDDAMRLEYREGFQAGRYDFMLAQQRSAGRGFNFNRAETVVYYSNAFGYYLRSQSEDRTHRGVMGHSVTYVDMVAHGTIDQRIVLALREGQDVQDLITNDPKKDWI
jgi:SNF2 family DNA or RNA helicase